MRTSSAFTCNKVWHCLGSHADSQPHVRLVRRAAARTRRRFQIPHHGAQLYGPAGTHRSLPLRGLSGLGREPASTCRLVLFSLLIMANKVPPWSHRTTPCSTPTPTPPRAPDALPRCPAPVSAPRTAAGHVLWPCGGPSACMVTADAYRINRCHEQAHWVSPRACPCPCPCGAVACMPPPRIRGV